MFGRFRPFKAPEWNRIMALIDCEECGKEVSTKAKICPACGAPVKKGSSSSNLALAIILVVISLSFCNYSAKESSPPSINKKSSAIIHNKMYGENWPFTVASGVLECRNHNEVIFKANGITYAINGKARSKRARGEYEDFKSIWRDDPKIPGAKIPVGHDIIQKGLQLC